ncbi:enoyl-CoA hydratase/isomerase family protein [Olivibacter sp. SDN3]|uniref:enoyl-CoA hydratase/isomerase family protein n=1 Tax=Olivibacter sp. SDN3 TaxID=2764720 RepID=UPI00165161B7|nr:enoyl-CoA hydratase/isomerase family protein [Olivibacter sp. SDN3]QNL48865.1 enoyl-CoA hydratase/isomerase family protein [Olivibacter sp. SDN3]
MKNHHIPAGKITTTISNQVATVIFEHPSHNALPSDLLKQLAAEIRNLGKNKAINVILLTSAGIKTFCAGANFDELLTIRDRDSGKTFFAGFAHVINEIRLSSKLVIGRVQGKAIGGAVGLAAACDYCFAHVNAHIKLSELTIGIGPFVIAPVIQRKMGLNALTRLSFNPEIFRSADWAMKYGLFQSVYEDIEQLDEAVQEFCQKLSKYPPTALSELKKTLWQGTDHWDTMLLSQAEISGSLVVEQQTKTLLENFKNKKK